MSKHVDLDALELQVREAGRTVPEPRIGRDEVLAVIAEVRISRKVVEAARGLLGDVDYPGADGLGAQESDYRDSLRAALVELGAQSYVD